MKLLEYLKNLSDGPFTLTGMKKLSWINSKGKREGLITFGNQKEIILSLDNSQWDNILMVPLNNQQVVELMKQQQTHLQQQGGQIQQIKQAYEQIARENMDLNDNPKKLDIFRL